MKELLEDKNRLKIDVRVVFGKSELQPAEIKWLRSLDFVRTSFCQNLHARCYLNESSAIITSMNLYGTSAQQPPAPLDREYRESYRPTFFDFSAYSPPNRGKYNQHTRQASGTCTMLTLAGFSFVPSPMAGPDEVQ